MKSDDEMRLRFAESAMVQLLASHEELNKYVGAAWQTVTRQMCYAHEMNADERYRFKQLNSVFDENVSGMISVVAKVSFMMADEMLEHVWSSP